MRIGKILGSLLPLLICSILLFPHRALAQEYRGTISGSVTDPSGAVVPGAKVEILEVQTGTINRTVSDHAGQYVVPFLLPGNYSITATATGFQTLTRSGITLVSQGHLIINLALTVGQESRTIEVTGAAPLLDLANGSVGDAIETKSVADLPLNGRAPEMLASLAVGVMITSAPHQERPWDADNVWSMGGSTNSNEAPEILLDGSPDEDFDSGWAFSPQEDGTEEVTVQPFATDASYGHTISGVINSITKSGTNALHGTAYEFNAISDLDANTFFDDRNVPVTPTPVSHFNQYGLTAGGPVRVPKVFNGRNKLFFFFGWEALKQVSPTPTILTVPTAAEREGDFSTLLAGGSSYQLYEPNTGTLSGGKFTRTPVPNNCLTNLSAYCSSVANAGIKIDPIALAYMKLYPAPNYTSGVSPITNEDNFDSNAPNIVDFNSFFGRVDYNASARDHVFFDVRRTFGSAGNYNYFGNYSTAQVTSRWNWGTTLDNVFTLNPTTVFDVRLNSTVHGNDEHGATAGTSLNPTSVGFPSYMQSASDFVVLPKITLSTFESFAPNSTTKLSTFLNYQIFADMMKIVGRHTLKIGLDGRQYREHQINPADSSGSFTFAANFVNSGTSGTSQPCCYDLASFEYGLPTSGDFELEPNGDFRTYYIGAFAQDDWRVNNHLTINVGLRYDVGTPWGEKFGRTVSGFNPSALNSASTAAAAFAPTAETVNDTTVNVSSINALGGLTFPSSDWGAPYQIQNKTGFWSPRFGFSYNPARFSKTVLRGGFGVFVAPQTISKSDDAGYINQEGFSATTAYAATNNSYYTSESTLDNPFAGGFVQPTGASQGANTFLGSPSAISFLAPVEHDLYAERWTLGVQQAVTANTMVELIYEGNHAEHLPVSNNINATELQYLTTNPYRDQNLSTATATAVKNPFAGLLPNGSSSYNGATTSLSNLLVPYPQFGSAAITEEDMTVGQSFLESGMLHIEHRARNGLTLTANYQFSKTIEEDTYLNPQDTRLFRGVSPNADFRHHFTVGGVYELPFGRGKLFSLGGGQLANEIAGGWVLNGIYQFQTGLPIDFTGDIPLQPGMNIHDIKSHPHDASTTTPALSTTPFVTGSSSTCTVSASQPCDGTVFFNGQYVDHYRTLPTTMSWVRQDGYNNLDASMLKNFALNKDDSTYLQLRFETFNTLNHPSFGTPVLTPTSSTFGYIDSVSSKSLSRQVQLGGRIVF